MNRHCQYCGEPSSGEMCDQCAYTQYEEERRYYERQSEPEPNPLEIAIDVYIHKTLTLKDFTKVLCDLNVDNLEIMQMLKEYSPTEVGKYLRKKLLSSELKGE